MQYNQITTDEAEMMRKIFLLEAASSPNNKDEWHEGGGMRRGVEGWSVK
jgi:hypothetical protein